MTKTVRDIALSPLPCSTGGKNILLKWNEDRVMMTHHGVTSLYLRWCYCRPADCSTLPALVLYFLLMPSLDFGCVLLF